MKKFVFFFIALLLVIISGYVYWSYFFVISDGTRVGILFKFTRTGTVFKTFEGEMIQPGLKTAKGINTNNFFFSVSDPNMAQKLNEVQGKVVEVHYKQYRKYLPWRGETYPNQEGQMMVDQIISVKDAKIEDATMLP